MPQRVNPLDLTIKKLRNKIRYRIEIYTLHWLLSYLIWIDSFRILEISMWITVDVFNVLAIDDTGQRGISQIAGAVAFVVS